MSSEVVIRASGLGKRYEIFASPADRLMQLVETPLTRALGREPRARGREVWALRGVDFEVERGETLGVIGRNGSGKSTLLQMLCGTVNPTEGHVFVDGRVAALLELGAGFNPEFSGRENVFLSGMLLGLQREEIEQRFDDIAAFADIGQYIDEPAKTYSSGMFVRLAFAVATSVNADVLIIDEALAVGDARFQARCMKRLRQIQDRGASVLFVSHDVSAVRALCQRALWLDGGRARALGPVLQVTSRYMESIFADDPEAAAEVGGIGTGMPGVAESEAATSVHNVRVAEDGIKAPKIADVALDARPVAHWGEEVGLIRSANVLDVNGQPVDLIYWGDVCRVRIRFVLPESYSPDTFGVAFSIKDLRGSDIIVSSTHDAGEARYPNWRAGDEVEVEFDFENGLVEGKYFLVAALERRHGTSIEYYEYVEGARYFSSLTPRRFSGVYQPSMKHRFREASGVR